MSDAVERIRAATRGTDFEGRLYLVGGVLRDRVLGLPASDDVDLVLEGDALALARFLHERGLSDHAPVLYPRFGTAMVSIGGHPVELVTARAEVYDPGSRKPLVRHSSLRDDVLRRDFTINTLLENVHTGALLDLTGQALADIAAGVVRTPLEPRVTFHDDPLRMLRAVRFAVRFHFEIEPGAWAAICSEAGRVNLLGPRPPVVSAERIRDEFVKILLSPDPVHGVELLRRAGLLAHFAPELLSMVGVTQNAWHSHDVWEHTMRALACLGPDAGLPVRLAVLFHDVGKPATRTEDERGVHFYEHQFVGAGMAADLTHRLRFPNDTTAHVVALVELHMRLGEARPEWSDAAIRRLIRAVDPYAEELFRVARCDMAAMAPGAPVTDLDALRERMDALNRASDVARITSPLDGHDIMAELGIGGGPVIAQAKDFLVNEVLDGRIAEGDREGARAALRSWWGRRE